jgi:hypothetical protein
MNGFYKYLKVDYSFPVPEFFRKRFDNNSNFFYRFQELLHSLSIVDFRFMNYILAESRKVFS